MVMRVDHRTLHFVRDDEALAEVGARRGDWLEQQLALARLFCRIDRKAAFFPVGCSSIHEFASRRGYDGPRAGDLCQLGYALAAEPTLEKLLQDDQIGFPAACAIGRIYQDPRLLEAPTGQVPGDQGPGDEWIRWARFERLDDLRRRIRQRVETVRQQRPADRPFSAYVTARTQQKVDRCRRVASQKAGAMLTNGQLLDLLATVYLLENDQLERGEPGQPIGTRRLPPTAQRPYDRTIPAEVARALAERSGGLCEFGSCERLGVETCHLVPHRDGGGREVTDLVQGCRPHHKSFDAGLIRFLAFTHSDDALGDDALGAGLPVFLVVETNEILKPKPRPQQSSTATSTAGAGEEQPAWLLRALGKRLRERLLRARAGGVLESRPADEPADGPPDGPPDGPADGPADGPPGASPAAPADAKGEAPRASQEPGAPKPGPQKPGAPIPGSQKPGAPKPGARMPGA